MGWRPNKCFSVHNNDGSIDTYNSIKELNAAGIKNVNYNYKNDKGFVGNLKEAYDGWVNATGETARAKETMYAYISGVGAFLAPAIASEVLVARGISIMNVIPEGKLANHIFSGKPEKFIDSQYTRSLITKIANTSKNFQEVDRFGKGYYATNVNGVQVYAYVQNGIIKGAGYNTKPVDLIKVYKLIK